MRDASTRQARRRLRLAFLIHCCGNLAGFSMTASKPLLPLVMAWDGVAETITGPALSASVEPVVLIGLLCGRYIARIGAALVLVTGYEMAANLSLDLLSPGPATVFGMRMVHGVALGLVIPAALILGHYVAYRLNGFNSFAIFTSTIPGTQMIGPPLGDWWLQTFARAGYFLATASIGGLALNVGGWIFDHAVPDLPARALPTRPFRRRLPANPAPNGLPHGPGNAYRAHAVLLGLCAVLSLQARNLRLPAFYQVMMVAVISTRISIAGGLNPDSKPFQLGIRNVISLISGGGRLHAAPGKPHLRWFRNRHQSFFMPANCCQTGKPYQPIWHQTALKFGFFSFVSVT